MSVRWCSNALRYTYVMTATRKIHGLFSSKCHCHHKLPPLIVVSINHLNSWLYKCTIIVLYTNIFRIFKVIVLTMQYISKHDNSWNLSDLAYIVLTTISLKPHLSLSPFHRYVIASIVFFPHCKVKLYFVSIFYISIVLFPKWIIINSHLVH